MQVRDKGVRNDNMNPVAEKINKHASEADASWGSAYGLFSKLVEKKKLKVGVEVGVAFGGHAEAILKNTPVDRLYGVDSYLHFDGYDDPMNLPQEEFNQLHVFTLERLSPFGDRYQHIRKKSQDAVNDVPEVDFVYIDAEHSYAGVWHDLCAWYSKIRIGGVIGGHDYEHPNFPGVKQAIEEFFKRFDWGIHHAGEGVWWVEKKPLFVSYIMPAYNCAATVCESVESIMQGNFEKGDELIIVNDCSTDDTENAIRPLIFKYPQIALYNHSRNKGGAAARNTAVEHASNALIFCLDSDNVLEPGSVQKLKTFMVNSGADVAAFQELHYFRETKDKITHKWIFKEGCTTLADYLAGTIVLGASGNYMFTKNSWLKAGGYPEFAGALDAWGFGFRQVATGSKMVVMSDSYYYHRYGHESYWVRDSKKNKTSLTAIQILIPFIDLINEKDADYIMSRAGRYDWLEHVDKHPVRIKSFPAGKTGFVVNLHDDSAFAHKNILGRLLNFLLRNKG